MKDWREADMWHFAHLLSKIGVGEGRTGDSGGPGEGLPPETPGLFASPTTDVPMSAGSSETEQGETPCACGGECDGCQEANRLDYLGLTPVVPEDEPDTSGGCAEGCRAGDECCGWGFGGSPSGSEEKQLRDALMLAADVLDALGAWFIAEQPEVPLSLQARIVELHDRMFAALASPVASDTETEQMKAALAAAAAECEGWMRAAGVDGADQPTREDFERVAAWAEIAVGVTLHAPREGEATKQDQSVETWLMSSPLSGSETELREALARVGVPLEVLRLQIEAKPYREMTEEFQASIVEATEIVRAALAASGADCPQETT